MFSEEFEEHLKEALKEAVRDCAPDLLSDMVRDNPDWWSRALGEVYEETIKKALKDDKLIKAIMYEIVGVYLYDVDLQKVASEIIEEKLKSSVLDKITVEVKR